jgi:hypothetical protein
VTVFEARPETRRGRVLYRMLLAVHDRIRADLDRVERLGEALRDGLPPEGLEEEIAALKSSSLLWQFQVSCLRYCSFVHMHHNAEDVEFFDELEETNPALAPVVERLRADHRAVSNYLDGVEEAARALTADDSPEARQRVAKALERLKGHLLAHLAYEEENVAATALRLREFAA